MFTRVLPGIIMIMLWDIKGFSGGSEVKASACSVGDLGLIPGVGRSPGEGNGNPLQYPCHKNPVDRGAWWATVHGVAESRTRLSNFPMRYKKGNKYFDVQFSVSLVRGKNNGLTAQPRVKREAEDTRVHMKKQNP